MKFLSALLVGTIAVSGAAHHFEIGNIFPLPPQPAPASPLVDPKMLQERRDMLAQQLAEKIEREQKADNLLTYQPPTSTWLHDQRKRALTRLRRHNSDVLVVPFQVSGNGLDASARSLMTLSVAQRIANGTDLKVANPVLVSRALGANSRTFSEEEITKLASTLDVTQVVVSHIGHDNLIDQKKGGTFNLKSTLYERDPINNKWKESQSHQFEAKNVRFTYEEPPYHAFMSKKDKLIQTVLGMESRLLPAPTHLVKRPVLDIGDDVASFFETTDRGIMHEIHALQLLGSLHEPTTSLRDRPLLFERSLVLLEHIDPASDDYALLQARALAQLNRRAAAVKLLNELPDVNVTPEIEKLHNYLNGNIDKQSDDRSDKPPGALDIIAMLENTRLLFDYGREPDWTKLGNTIQSVSDQWQYLLSEAFLDQYVWQQHSNGPLKALMDLIYQNPAYSPEAIEMRLAIDSEASLEKEYTRAILKEAANIEEADLETNALSAAPSDLADLFRNTSAENVMMRMHRFNQSLGKPKQALEVADEQIDLFHGHPDISVSVGSLKVNNMDPGDSQDRFGQMAIDGLLWSGNRTLENYQIARSPMHYYAYFSYLSSEQKKQITFANDWPQPPVTPPDCLINTIQRLYCLSSSFKAAMKENRTVEASKLLRENSNRFHGSQHLMDFRYTAYEALGDTKGLRELQQKVMDGEVSDWALYSRVAKSLVLESRHEDVSRLIKGYPGFHEPGHASGVKLANRAFEFGSLLWWAGAYKPAEDLYEIATQYNTGAGAEMAAKVRLALIDQNYNRAIETTKRRVRRYRSAYSLRDLIGLFAYIGEFDNAHSVLDSATEKLKEPELWTGALILYRAHGLSDDQVSDRLERIVSTGKDKYELSRLSARYVFLSNVIDRHIPNDLPKRLQDRQPQQTHYISPWHNPYDRLPARQQGFDMVGLETLKNNNSTIPSRPAMAAQALHLIDQKNYQQAFELFDLGTYAYSLNEFLPYYALASVKTGNTKRISQYLDHFFKDHGSSTNLTHKSEAEKDADFDARLSQAILLAHRGNHLQALSMLKMTNSDVRHTSDRFIFTRYQIMEVARLLFEHTNEASYRTFALDLARRNDIIEPIQSYSVSFIAMLSESPAERIVALSKLLRMDPGSRGIKTASAEELEKARKLVRYPSSKISSSVDSGI